MFLAYSFSMHCDPVPLSYISRSTDFIIILRQPCIKVHFGADKAKTYVYKVCLRFQLMLNLWAIASGS